MAATGKYGNYGRTQPPAQRLLMFIYQPPDFGEGNIC